MNSVKKTKKNEFKKPKTNKVKPPKKKISCKTAVVKKVVRSPYELFVEDSDFLRWSFSKLPITQMILNVKYVEKQALERDLKPPFSQQKYKEHTLLTTTFDHALTKEILKSRDFYDVFDGFEPVDWNENDFALKMDTIFDEFMEETLETIEKNHVCKLKPEISSINYSCI